MERFDITIQMYSADASGTQYVWEKVPAEEGDFVLYADAQATIAALQARVQELEDDRSAWKEIAQDWSAAAKLAEQPEKFYDGYSAAVMNAMQALLTKARADLARVTAGLERVRGERDDMQRAAQGMSNDLTGIGQKYDELRTLIAALPKVEGEVTVRDITALYWANDGTYGSIDCKEQLVSLLKHRQGME